MCNTVPLLLSQIKQLKMFLKSCTVSIPELYSKLSSIHTFRELVPTDDWSSDQYRWVNQGVRSLPKKSPLVRSHTSRYTVRTPDGPSKEFTRHAYQLLPPNSSSITLVHYVGNEKVAVDFPMEIKSTTRRMHTHELALLFCGTSKLSVQKVYLQRSTGQQLQRFHH